MMGMWSAAGGVPPAGWVETFEGTGYVKAVWTETGTPNEDYTTSPLVGSQSLSVAFSDVVQSSNLGTFTQAKLVVKFPSLTQTGVSYFFGFRDSTASTTVVSIAVDADDKIQLAHGSYNALSAGTISANQQYVIWLDYAKGTGSNGIASVYVAADTGNDGIETKPGSAFVSLSSGTSTADAATFRILHAGQSTGASIIFDNVEKL